jgi:hypothetical protein
VSDPAAVQALEKYAREEINGFIVKFNTKAEALGIPANGRGLFLICALIGAGVELAKQVSFPRAEVEKIVKQMLDAGK